MKKQNKRANRGETLVESLVSILIFTLASILFLTMVSSASRINATARAADERYQAQQTITETGLDASGNAADGGAATEGTVKITLGEKPLYSGNVKVVRQENDPDSTYAYYSVPTTPTP